MKEKLCFRKYKTNSIWSGVLIVVLLVLCLLLGTVVGYIGFVICLFGFGSVVAYNVFCYIAYQKKVKDMVPKIGTIFNWNLSGHRSRLGCVTLKVDEKEFCSPHYFMADDAENMVGKTVSYVIVDDTLLIYEILE